jgi:hypothetical protein
VRAEKPIDNATSALRPIEAIPTPAAKEPAAPTLKAPEPTVAPIGPAVEPAPPAADTRDVPAAETSSGLLRRIESPIGDRTT